MAECYDKREERPFNYVWVFERMVSQRPLQGVVAVALFIDEAFDILEVNQVLTALTARVAARAVGRGAGTRRLKAALDAVSVAQDGGDDAAIAGAVREFLLAELQIVDNDELRRFLTSMRVLPLLAVSQTGGGHSQNDLWVRNRRTLTVPGRSRAR